MREYLLFLATITILLPSLAYGANASSLCDTVQVMNFRDMSDNSITTLKPDTTFQITVEVNPRPTRETYSLLQFLDENGSTVYLKSATISSTGKAQHIVKLGEGKYRVESFVWENIDTPNPITQKIEYVTTVAAQSYNKMNQQSIYSYARFTQTPNAGELAHMIYDKMGYKLMAQHEGDKVDGAINVGSEIEVVFYTKELMPAEKSKLDQIVHCYQLSIAQRKIER